MTSPIYIIVILSHVNAALRRHSFIEIFVTLLYKGLWGLLNNAGISGYKGPVEWLIRDDYKTVLNVNLHGLIDVTVTFLPLLKKAKGRIVNMSSVYGRIAVAEAAPYAISKHGVEAYSDSIR